MVVSFFSLSVMAAGPQPEGEHKPNSLSRKMQQGCPTSSPSALAWHEEIIDNREDEQCQQKPVEYRFPFALEKLVCVHFPFAFSPRCENELRTAEYSVRPSLPFWRHFPFAFYVAF
jgi:hypothetical protein